MKSERKKKIIKRACLIIFSIILLIILVAVIILCKMSASMGVGSAPVADYDKRVEIWNNVPGSSAKKKIPQFIAWGTKDTMVGITETHAYIEKAKLFKHLNRLLMTCNKRIYREKRNIKKRF